MKKRPILDLQKNEFDLILEVLGILFLLILIVMPAIYYWSLPETIASHFNAKGEPDGYSGKWVIWLLPLIGTVTYVGLRKLSRIPHTYNYPMKIDRDNAEVAYRNSSRMMTSMAVIITGAFCYINFAMIRSAKDGFEGLGKLFLPFFICLLFGSIFFFTYKTINYKK